MVSASDIVDLARQIAGRNFDCGDDEDLLNAGGFDGETSRQFIAKFTETYSVDMKNFLHFFHDINAVATGTPRIKPVGLDGKTFPPIPITPRLLADAANQETWPLEYPTHTLRSSRWPLFFMFVLLALLVLAVTVLIADI